MSILSLRDGYWHADRVGRDDTSFAPDPDGDMPISKKSWIGFRMVQLCEDLIPLAHAADFKLVFEGRVGWMVDDLLVEMRNTPQLLLFTMPTTTCWPVFIKLRPSMSIVRRLRPANYRSFGSRTHVKRRCIAQGFSPYIDPTDGGLVRNAEAMDRRPAGSRTIRAAGPCAIPASDLV